MTYPTLPFALVHMLIGITDQRKQLRPGPKHVTVIAHFDKRAKPIRFEVENDNHWTEVLQGAIKLFTEEPVHTMTFIYPTSGEEKIDRGIIIERNKEPVVFDWHYDNFNLWLVDRQEEIDQIKNGVGVQELQGLINKGQAFNFQIQQPSNIPNILSANN